MLLTEYDEVEQMELFKEVIAERNKDESANTYLVETIEDNIKQLYRQLSLFEGEENGE